MKLAVVGSINMDMTVTAQRIPGKGETLLGESVSYIPGGKAELTQERHDGNLIVGVENAVVYERIFLVAPWRVYDDAALFIVGGCQVIRLGRGKAAVGAAHFSDVMIAHVFILEPAAAIGAGAHVVYYIDAFVPVGRQADYGEIAALIVLFEPAADRIVGV